MKLSPTQYIKKDILLTAVKYDDSIKLEMEVETEDDVYETIAFSLTAETIDEEYDHLIDDLYDVINEYREGCYETDIDSDSYSRHYDCHGVAKEVEDGVWVGWTYWYGGGKHSEPDAIDWMEDAYFLDVVEEEKLVVVREFSKQG